MNVGDLKLVLADLDDDLELICQKDSEGNGYVPLGGAQLFGYHDGEAYILSLTPELEEHGYTNEDMHPGAVPSVLLYPEY